MIESIQLDIPQLPVKWSDGGAGNTRKDMIHLGQEFIVFTFPRHKLLEIAVRHATLNSFLHEIYYLHNVHKSKRQDGLMYSFDEDHFKELFLIDLVIQSLWQISEQLLATLYFIVYATETRQMPPEQTYMQQLATMERHEKVGTKIKQHSPFLYLLHICTGIGQNYTVRKGEYFHLTHDLPHFIQYQKLPSGILKREIPLNEIITKYKTLFNAYTTTIESFYLWT